MPLAKGDGRVTGWFLPPRLGARWLPELQNCGIMAGKSESSPTP